MAILVENHKIFPLPKYFCPYLEETVSLGIGYRRWRWKMRMMGQSGRKEVWQ